MKETKQRFPATLLYCRPGFENECAQEITAAADTLSISGHITTKPDSGLVAFIPHQDSGGRLRNLRFDEFIFPRQVIHDAILCDKMPTGDRITPLLQAIKHGLTSAASQRYSDMWLETADTNEAKELSGFLRRFEPAFTNAVRNAGLLAGAPDAPRLHVMFLDSAAAWIGVSSPDNSAPWPMGIPRLKMPRGAPSRSTLKLAEALHVMLTPDEFADWLHEGLTAVDLGAAPGGWTWQLVHHGLHVTAIDNGAMDPVLMASNQVEHRREDGFHYRPKRPVDWVVCDMIEKPARIATLMADWVADGHAKRAVFNLKLPMKKRREQVLACRDDIARRLAGVDYSLRFRQLYHDREEVTAVLLRREKAPRPRRR